jgi:hypothetical protein
MKGKLIVIVLAVTSGLLAGLFMPMRAGGAQAPVTFNEVRRLMGYRVVLRGIDLPAGEFLRSTVLCPAGKEVLGGGASVIREGSADFHTVIQESGPGTIGARYLWGVAIRNDDTVTHRIGLFAICADVKRRFNDIG